MRLFAIGDLHMSGGDEKPMDVFGPQWDRHFFHIRDNWQATVHEEDTVLIPGDISWAMQLKEAEPDLCEIGELPGQGKSRLLVELHQPGAVCASGVHPRASAQRGGPG